MLLRPACAHLFAGIGQGPLPVGAAEKRHRQDWQEWGLSPFKGCLRLALMLIGCRHRARSARVWLHQAEGRPVRGGCRGGLPHGACTCMCVHAYFWGGACFGLICVMRAVGRTGAPTALIMHAAPNIEPAPLLQLLPVHQLTQTPAQKYAPPSWQAAQEVAVLSHTLEDMDKMQEK